MLGAAAGAASLSADGALSLTRVVGEQGAAAELTVLLPPHGPGAVSRATLNGKVVRFDALPPLDGRPPAVRIRGAWAGERFGRAHEIVAAGGFSGGRWTGTFSVPAAVLEQLAASGRSCHPSTRDAADVCSQPRRRLNRRATGRTICRTTLTPTPTMRRTCRGSRRGGC